MRRILPLLIVIALLMVSSVVYARDGIPDNCETHGAHQRVNLFPRYEPQHQQYVLRDWTTGDVAVTLESNLLPDELTYLEWSPDCRYLAAKVGADTREVWVWDTVAGGRIVLTNMQPTRWALDWSNNGQYMVALTYDGYVLWHMETRHSIVLPNTPTNAVRVNFNLEGDYLYWDDNSVPGLRYFDLATGQEVSSSIATTGQVEVIDSNAPATYECVEIYEGTYILKNTRTDAQVYLDSDGSQIVLREGFDRYGYDEQVIQVIEASTDTIYEFTGWSSGCRYAAAAVGRRGQNNTVVWDTQNNQRIGLWEDARNGTHGLSWSPNDGSVIIQTRDGAYLWNVPSNTRTQLHDTAAAGFSVRYIQWLPERGVVLAVPVGANGVVAYDINTGEGRAFYHIAERNPPVNYRMQDEWLYVYTNEETGNRGAALWNLNNGQQFQMTHPWLQPSPDLRYRYRTNINEGREWNWALSPEKRYFVAMLFEDNIIKVWDLHEPTEDGRANYIHNVSYVDARNPITWVDETTLDFGSGLARWDIVNGIQIGTSPVVTADGAAPVVVSTAASDGVWGVRIGHRNLDDYTCPFADAPQRYGAQLWLDANNRQLKLLDPNGDDLVLEENYFGRMNNTSWSPDCRYVAASIGYWSATPDIVARGYGGSIVAIWDTTTGERVLIQSGTFYDIIWSPRGDMAIIRPWWYRPVSKLWHIGSDTTINLSRHGYPDYSEVYFDYGRGQFYVSGWAGAVAYDMQTGVQQQIYTRPHDGPSTFIISDDGSYLVSFTNVGQRGYDYKGLTVWNLNTLDNFQLNVEDVLPYGADEIQLSPDNRYLVVRYDDLRVWDLQAVPDNLTDRLPNQRLPISDTARWTFEDARTLIVNDGGVITRYILGG